MHKKQFDIREIEEGAYYPGVFIIKLKKILKENIQYDYQNQSKRKPVLSRLS